MIAHPSLLCWRVPAWLEFEPLLQAGFHDRVQILGTCASNHDFDAIFMAVFEYAVGQVALGRITTQRRKLRADPWDLS